MLHIETAAGSLHCADEGPRDGDAIVFANSLGTDFRVWDKVVARLPSGLRVIRYDKRGHGLSDCPPRGTWGMGDHVADAAAVMDACGARDAVFVGLSIGGMIAQGLAAERPDLVRAMVLSNTGAKIGAPEMWRERIAAIEENGVAAMSEAILERWFTPAFREGSRGELALWRNMLVRTTLDGYAGSCAAIADTDLRESTSRLRIPTLALCGDQDGVTPPDLVRETADLIPGAAFQLIRGAGHIPGVEQPDATAAAISGFLASVGHGG